jgi:hypothetical protein
MKENPLASILDREIAKKHAVEHFPDQIDLLRDLSNYGSNLILRAYNSSSKNLTAVVVCGVLLKQIVSMFDAIEALVSEGIVHAAFLQARAAFEASVYLDWILFSDSDRKAESYIVSNYREERLWASRGIQGTPEEAAFGQLAKTLGLDIHLKHPTLAREAKKHLAEVNRILAQPAFQQIDAEFEKKKGRKKIDPEWYEVVGARSIREVAKSVGRLAEYELFYSKGSKITHSALYKDHIRFVKTDIHLKRIRHLEGIDTLIQSVVHSAIHSFGSVLAYYRPGELNAFRKKYIEDWRVPFLGVKSVKYNF